MYTPYSTSDEKTEIAFSVCPTNSNFSGPNAFVLRIHWNSVRPSINL
jgi:hypothetical protein